MRSNQFGGSIGGPIKKDKAFFFFDYQGSRYDIGTNIVYIPGIGGVSASANAGSVALRLKPVDQGTTSATIDDVCGDRSCRWLMGEI